MAALHVFGGIPTPAVAPRNLNPNRSCLSRPAALSFIGKRKDSRLSFASCQSDGQGIGRSQLSGSLPSRSASPAKTGAAPVKAVLKESQALRMGTRAPEFELVEPLTGKVWTLDEFDGHCALLVMFICSHCPFVVHVRKELMALTSRYIEKGLGVVAINSNSLQTHPQDVPEFMAQEAQQLGYRFPYLFDESQEVAKAYRAACTPDFYVFRKEGRRPFELAYHGQLDESRPSNGVPVTGRDLRSAIDFVLSGRPVTMRQKPSIGCNIKWTPGKEPDYF